MHQKDIDNFKNLLYYLRKIGERRITPSIEKHILSLLDSTLPFFSHLVTSAVFPKIYRLTINKRVIGENKRIRDIKYLKYPPVDKVSQYGRCNYPKQSILYASFSSMTSINECQPIVGDLITESVWQVKGDQPLKYCPIFKNQPHEENVINLESFEINHMYEEKLKIYPVIVQELIDLLHQFIADAFTKRIHSSNDLDYIFSAYFSNKIFTDLENGTIEAIFYPSVKEKLSFENLAIKPEVFDAKYELVEVRDSVCIMDTRNGLHGYYFNGLSDCKTFNFNTGKILWDPKQIHQSIEKLLKFKELYGINISD